jgi:hypothetical protein
MEQSNHEAILMPFLEVMKSMTKVTNSLFDIAFAKKPINRDEREVVLYELITSRERILNIIRELDSERFGFQTVQVAVEPSGDKLFLCPYCGNPECTSDHK